MNIGIDMQNLLRIWRDEPAVVISAITGLIEAVVILLIAFGVDVSTEQKAAILGVSAALGALLIAVLGGVATRSQVSPKSRQGGPL